MSSSAFRVGNNPRGLYYFFTRLLPGLVVLLGLGFITPHAFMVSLPVASVILIGIVLSFVTGQIMHSLAAALERTVPFTNPHREYAYQLLDTIHTDLNSNSDGDSGLRHQLLRSALKDEYQMRIGDDGLKLDVEGLYVLLRSRVELDGRGRTLQYQALILFSRNMGLSLLFVGLFVLLSSQLKLAYSPIIPQFSGSISLGIVGLLWLSGIGLIVRNEYYKQLYADYLILDFCNLVRITDRSIGG